MNNFDEIVSINSEFKVENKPIYKVAVHFESGKVKIGELAGEKMRLDNWEFCLN